MPTSWRGRERTRPSIAASFGESLNPCLPPRWPSGGSLWAMFGGLSSRHTNSCTTCGALIFVYFLHFSASSSSLFHMPGPVYPRKPLRVDLEVVYSWFRLNVRGCKVLAEKFFVPRFSVAAAPVCASAAKLTVNVAPLPSCPVTLTGHRTTLSTAHLLLPFFFVLITRRVCRSAFKINIHACILRREQNAVATLIVRAFQNGTTTVSLRTAACQN